MTIPSIGDVVQKLDKLDGRENGQYTDMDLRSTTVVVCVMQEELATAIGNATVPIITAFENPHGETVNVDCKVLAERLNTLIDIAQRNPAGRFLAHRQKDVPTKEELHLYHMTDHMISTLLLGVATTDMSLGDIFSKIPFDSYTQTVDELCRTMPPLKCAKETMTIHDTGEGYKLFEAAGKKYGFDAAPFKPAEKPAPIPPKEEKCPENTPKGKDG